MDEQEREWLRRIDKHLDDIRRGNETARDYMREGRELMAQLGETIERNRVAFEDLRTYLQQATTVLGALVVEIRAGEQEHRDSRRESREWRERWRDESREWRQSLSDKVDRLGNDPPPTPA